MTQSKNTKLVEKVKNHRHFEVFSYISIGLVMTFGTFVLWNIFILLGKSFLNIPFETLFSTSQFLAAFIFIFPSFYLNRKITFAKLELSQNKALVLFKVYAVYLISPAIASLITYILELTFRFESKDFVINYAFLKDFDFNYGRYLLQIIGLLISTFGNFFGQKLFLYRKK